MARRRATRFVGFVGGSVTAALVAAAIVSRLSGGYGAVLSIDLVLAIAAGLIARTAWPQPSQGSIARWMVAAFLLAGLPVVVWLSWRESK